VALTRRVQISIPLHLAPKLVDTYVILCFHQRTQCGIQDSLFAVRAGAAHGLLQQLAIDLDVGP
jgi:hypothetical protein